MTEIEPGRSSNGSCADLAAPPLLLEPAMIEWLKSAACLPGRSLHVALAVVIANGGCARRPLALPNLPLLEMRLDRCAKYRGLSHLECAGLVTVHRQVGRSPLVTICARDNR